MQPDLKTAKGSGIDIRYAHWRGNGRKVICLHGLTANCRCWDPVASTLAPRCDVMAVDLRGRGGSGRPETGYSLLHHVADVRCLLDDLGIDRAALMGHSLGAFIALAFASRYPDRTDRLVLVDGGGHLDTPDMDKVMAGIKPALDRVGVVFPSAEAYIGAIQGNPLLQPWNPSIEACYRYEIETTADGVRCNIDPAHIAQEAENLRKADVRYFYPYIQCDTLVLRATRGLLADDAVLLPQTTLAAMLRDIPKARSIDIPDVNHYGMIFQPNALRDQAVAEFLGVE